VGGILDRARNHAPARFPAIYQATIT
jgi:hypothetical protein